MSIRFWTDTHSHIHNDEYGRSVEELINIAKEQHVEYIVTVGTDYEDSIKAVEIANKYNNIYAVVGLHPEYANKYNKSNDYQLFYNMALDKKVVAIGETGLDFYYENNPSEEQQTSLFLDMIDIACKLNKPIVIHSRNAAKKCVNILDNTLKKYNNLKGIFHCFDGNLEVLDWVKDKNFYISYAGNITFKSADNLRVALSKTQIDKLLIETDSPYLAPVPVRGKNNMPANVVYTGKYIANFLNIQENILMEQLENNFRQIIQKI